MMMKSLMQRLKCLYTRSLLDRFAHRELSLGRQRYVGKHLDYCEDCRRDYQRLSRISRELETRLAGLGTPSTNSVNRIWADVQQHLAQQVPKQTKRNKRSVQISLASIVLLVMTVLPSVLSGTAVSAAPTLPTQPRAHISQAVSTMTPAINISEVEYLRATETPAEPVDVLRNTPESYATPQ